MHIWNFTDNKQADSFTAQLPFRLFVTIRFFVCSQVSGSVPRRRNKQSALFRRAAAGPAVQAVIQHMVCHSAKKAKHATRYGLRRPPGCGGGSTDP